MTEDISSDDEKTSYRGYLKKPTKSKVTSIRIGESEEQNGHCVFFRFDDNTTFTLSTEGDCCLRPYFAFTEDAKHEIIGHCIVSIYEERLIQDETTEIVYIVLDNGKKVTGKRINTITEYYGSWVTGKWSKGNASTAETDLVSYPPTAKITFVVGLPCSGKTTYSEAVYTNPNDEIHDDVLNNANITELSESLDEGKHLILIDPRFCEAKCFKNFMKTLFGDWTCPVPVETLLFICSTEDCIANWSANRDLQQLKPVLDEEIRKLSQNNYPNFDCYPNITLVEGYSVARRRLTLSYTQP